MMDGVLGVVLGWMTQVSDRHDRLYTLSDGNRCPSVSVSSHLTMIIGGGVVLWLRRMPITPEISRSGIQDAHAV